MFPSSYKPQLGNSLDKYKYNSTSFNHPLSSLLGKNSNHHYSHSQMKTGPTKTTDSKIKQKQKIAIKGNVSIQSILNSLNPTFKISITQEDRKYESMTNPKKCQIKDKPKQSTNEKQKQVKQQLNSDVKKSTKLSNGSPQSISRCLKPEKQPSLLQFMKLKKTTIKLLQSQSQQQIEDQHKSKDAQHTNKMVTKIQQNTNIKSNFFSINNNNKTQIKFQSNSKISSCHDLKQQTVNVDVSSNKTYGYKYDMMDQSFHSSNQLINNESNLNSRINLQDSRSVHWQQNPFTIAKKRNKIEETKNQQNQIDKPGYASWDIIKKVKQKSEIIQQKLQMKIKKYYTNQRSIFQFINKNGGSPSTGSEINQPQNANHSANVKVQKKKSFTSCHFPLLFPHKKVQKAKKNQDPGKFSWQLIIKSIESYGYYPSKLFYLSSSKCQQNSIENIYERNYKLRPKKSKKILVDDSSDDLVQPIQQEQQGSIKYDDYIKGKIQQTKNSLKKQTKACAYFVTKHKQIKNNEIKSLKNIFGVLKEQKIQIQTVALYFSTQNISMYASYNDIKKYQPRLLKNLYESYI